MKVHRMVGRSEAGAEFILAQTVESCSLSVTVLSGHYTESNDPNILFSLSQPALLNHLYYISSSNREGTCEIQLWVYGRGGLFIIFSTKYI